VPQIQQVQEVAVPAPVTTLPSLPTTTAIPNLSNVPTYSAPTPEISTPPAPAISAAPAPEPAIDPPTTSVRDTTATTATAPTPDTALAAPQEPAPAVSDETTATMTTPESPPAAAHQGPLLSATGRAGEGGNECNMSEAARETCDGPGCILSCASDACPNQKNETCEFVIDCAQEITADLVSDDKQCEDQTIEQTSISNANGLVEVNIVHLKVGERCKPPPCMK
jgi:hypothetical protein